MTQYNNAVSRYLAAWNAVGSEAIAKAVAEAWTEDGTYTDPLADVQGHEGIQAAIEGAHEQFPGFEFRLKGEVDGNHHIARFSWDLVSTADGSSPAGGSDVITLAEDGRIKSVSGFLDRVPSA
ncbi:nuclear transport factor 2 family protein [Streptomyces sp. NPDC085927]|uniref:nuclear transport factor 2 family protein n=1 Tax=unclassified Streptomyces TaxID=2593676 RepID=UPI00224B6A6E|nr:nuclear transport factor 2 family protein [Streptomyces sp. NEAU-W12]MCX2923456.1 nuclear transport factor 2 family protein [Streptomyces sp. NEAU-W12]